LALLAIASIIPLAFSPSVHAEKDTTITLTGRVEVSGLGVSAGRFRILALRAQRPEVELGRTTSDEQGRFQLTVEKEPLGLFGTILEAKSTEDASLVLEAAVLRFRDATEPFIISPATTVEAVLLAWKVRQHRRDPTLLRPFLLHRWLNPIQQPKSRKGLKRAEEGLVRWTQGAASGGHSSTAVLRATVGDPRRLRERLSDPKVSPKAVEEVEGMARTDAEVTYLLMMPYLLEL
jgi:hypothetical protein